MTDRAPLFLSESSVQNSLGPICNLLPKLYTFSNMNVAAAIKKRIMSHPTLTFWHINDFLSFGTKGNIKEILSRMAKAGIIRRCNGFDGIYYRPDTFMGVELLPSVSKLIAKIADIYGWTIVPSGEAALNAVGLSTQVPVVYEYISDGPNRSYCLFGITVSFRHVSPRFIKGMASISALFVEALRSFGQQNVREAQLKQMRGKLDGSAIERIIVDTVRAPAWIQRAALQLRGN